MWVAERWRDYELVDCGEGRKLERWGQYLIARPEPKALWGKADVEAWKKAEAVFEDEQWKFKVNPPEEWSISYPISDEAEGRLRFKLKPTDFKHTGVFPEQGTNWRWVWEVLKGKGDKLKVLNLFAYTGGMTMAAAKAGAHVTHVDASRPTLMWASENCQLSGVSKDRVRWIQDDALKFVKREVRRGVKYEGIIMDPPRFGRGAAGEVWKLEKKLPELIRAAKELLSPAPALFLINAYTADVSSVALKNLLSEALNKEVEFGELGVKESTSRGFVLPLGVFARWHVNL